MWEHLSKGDLPIESRANSLEDALSVPEGILPSHLVDSQDCAKGHLLKEDIERMVNEAEKYKTEDEATASHIQTKNGLESYAYNLHNSLTDSATADEFALEDKETLELSRPSSFEGGIRGKVEELEAIANPIMQKLNAAPGGVLGSAAPGDASEGGHSVEEVD
ncbi:hypothetical protein BDY19DRAFT_910725 [Irpex rosettiformis]|uniref:Uncharacterized protein n=1 Tax=Irpex rosettiformis TaxID=378272 RepID=A0ACB8TMV0_9APHY|nr:hypothetical protein BDY19DRAFT_910725 [Irpex rosettiformis]